MANPNDGRATTRNDGSAQPGVRSYGGSTAPNSNMYSSPVFTGANAAGNPVALNPEGYANIYGRNTGGDTGAAGQLFGSGSILTGKGLFGTQPYVADPGAFGQVGNSNFQYGQAAQSTQAANQGAYQQQQLIQMLMDQANGKGAANDAAQAQLRLASDRNTQQGMAMMASQRGPGAAASAYQSANQAGVNGQNLAGQSAQLQAQMQLAGQQQLGGVLGQQQQLSNQMVQFYLSQGNSIDQANRQAQIDLQKLNEQSYYGNSPPDSSVGGAAQSVMSGVGGVIAAVA